jgi:hypothetical protein
MPLYRGVEVHRRQVLHLLGGLTASGLAQANPNLSPTDVRAYGPVGAADDSAVLAAAQAASAHVIIPIGVIVNVKDFSITRDDWTLEINGTLRAIPGATNMLSVSRGAKRVRIFGTGFVDTNHFAASVGIRNEGSHTTLAGLGFKGDVQGSYIYSDGDYCTTSACRVMPRYICKNIPFKFYGASPVLENCRLEDVRGFNVQFAFCSNAVCRGNRFINPTCIATLKAAGAQNVFEEIDVFSADIDRLGCLVNDVQRQITSWTRSEGTRYSATITPAADKGDRVTFIGSKSLENIQFNSECNGAICEDNVCDGSGDSNIVIGCDYHKRINTAGVGVDENDFPRNIIVRNNICRNALASAVNMSHANGGQIEGNDCSAWGMRYDANGGPFYCAIFAGAGSPIRVGQNTLRADGKRTQYGVGGWETSNNTSALDFRSPHVPMKRFARQNVIGVLTARYFCGITAVADERRFDVDIEEGDWSELLQAGRKINDEDPAKKIAARSSWQFRPPSRALKFSLVKISVLAKNDGVSPGAVEVFYDNGKSGRAPSLTMTIRSSEWERYEILVPVSTIGRNGFFFRVSGGARDSVQIRRPIVLFKRLSIL